MADALLSDLLRRAKLAHLAPYLLGESLASLAERIEDDRTRARGKAAPKPNAVIVYCAAWSLVAQPALR